MKKLIVFFVLFCVFNLEAAHKHKASDIYGIFTSSQIPNLNMIEFAENDSVSCAANDFKIYADNSEQKLKACQDGVVSDLLFTGSTLPVIDTTSIAEGSSDSTKEVRLEVDGLTTATIRVITVPDANTVIPIASTCGGNDKVQGINSTTGALICDADDTGAGSPTFHGVKAFPSSNQSVNTATWSQINLGTETGGYDTDVYHDTVTNNQLLVVPSGLNGYYAAHMYLVWEANKNTGERHHIICKCPSGTAAANCNPASTCTQVGRKVHNVGTLGTDTVNGITENIPSQGNFSMSVGDMITCNVYQTHGSAVLVITNSNCSMWLVGQ